MHHVMSLHNIKALKPDDVSAGVMLRTVHMNTVVTVRVNVYVNTQEKGHSCFMSED